MFKLAVNRPLVSSSALKHVNIGSVRHKYAPPGGKSALPGNRALKKLTVGKTRPAIYHKFECVVELSDGSTVRRRSQFPRNEWRYLTDQRNNPVWNPSRPNLKALEADATGKLAKFQKKYEFFDVSESKDTENTSKEPSTSKESVDDEFFDLLEQNYVPVKGGRLATKRKSKKK